MADRSQIHDVRALEEEHRRLRRELFHQENLLSRSESRRLAEADTAKRERIESLKRRLAEIERELFSLKSETGGANMVMLSSRDRQRLSEELCRLPNWRDGGLLGEKGLLRAASLPEAWINSLPLSGVSITDAPSVITNLEEFGHLENKPTHYALGALVEHLLNATPHIEGKVFLAYLLSQYRLITNLDYLEELQREYGLLETQKADDMLDLGWQTQPPVFPWQGPKDPSELEAIWSKRAPFLDAVFLEKGDRVARAICRIEAVGSSPLGTGFLIGSHLVLTNHHVLPTDEMAESAQVRFGYRVDAAGHLRLGKTYRVKRVLNRSPTEQLDFAVLRIEDAPGEEAQIGFLTPKAESLEVGRPLYIIQHPMGEPQKIVLQDNWITYVADDQRRVQYLTNTQSGSSGSPACNGNWEVVALHHSRSPIPSTTQTTHLQGNEGIPMMAILPEIQHLLS